MNFKMRENSVFAILLRSAWWVSAVVAIVLIGLAGALMPPQYAPFGMLGATPFVVIAGMVLWRNRHAPDPARVQAALALAASQPWRGFVGALEASFAAQGYAVSPLPGGPGGSGADLRLDRRGLIVLVSAKRYKAATHGLEPLRDLATAMEAAAADRGIYVSLGEVTDQAAVFAKQRGIELVSAQRLGAMLLVKP
jgi:restriction system protein